MFFPTATIPDVIRFRKRLYLTNPEQFSLVEDPDDLSYVTCRNNHWHYWYAELGLLDRRTLSRWMIGITSAVVVVLETQKYLLDAFAGNEGHDQTAHLRSLIRAFVSRLQNQ